MPRSMWRGAVTFGLVNIPVSLYSASDRSEQISFRQLHGKDLSPIQYRRVCQDEGIEVPWAEIVKGYEHEKGKFVVVTDADLEKARVPATQTIDIRDFVPAEEIPWTFFEDAYHLEPTKQGFRAYALFREALKQSGRVAIGTIVLRQREHLTAMRPDADVLVLTTMRFANELRSPDELNLPRNVDIDPRELKLALQLIDTLAGPWDPSHYRDTYTQVLREAIEQKIQGKQVATPTARRAPAQVRDLLDALQESLKGRPLAKAPGRGTRAGARPTTGAPGKARRRGSTARGKVA
jgi:DNA end-binding protein Ku